MTNDIDPRAQLSGAEALTDERSATDFETRRERAVLDDALASIYEGDSASMRTQEMARAIAQRIRRQRRRADGIRAAARKMTDSMFESEQDDGRLVKGTLVPEDGDERTHALWLVMGELDVIATSAHSIRLRAVELTDAQQDAFFGLATAIDLATERMLALVGDLLDPRDDRGLYHEVGGESG